MRRFLTIICTLFMSIALSAKVKPAGIISDNMVLQQQTEVAIWGTAKPDSKVVIMPGWTKVKTTVKTGADGKWFVKVATPQASLTPYDIVFDDGEKTTVRNILIGKYGFAQVSLTWECR